MTKINPDISHYHPVKDWKKVKENCNFIISKATQRTDFIDSTLKDFVKNCEANKIPYWLYCFPEKGIEVESVEFFLKTVKPLTGNYLVGYALDVETDNKGKLVTPDGVVKAMERLKKEGYKTMLYTEWSQYSSWKDIISKIVDKDCAWWEARYGKNIGGKDYSADYPCHDNVELHQFTSTYTASYFTGGVDLSKIRNVKGKDLSWYMTPGKISTQNNSSTTVQQEVKPTMTKEQFIQKVIDVALVEVGYLEKKSNSNLDSKTANAGSNNYTKYGKWISCNGDFWCASFVSWCFYAAFGYDKGKSILTTYSPACETIRSKIPKVSGAPQPGDIIFFSGTRHAGANHIGIVYKVTSSTVYTIEGNTSGGSTVIDNGGGVAKKSYSRSYSKILSYGRPKYPSDTTTTSTPITNTTTTTTTKKTYVQANPDCALPKTMPSRGYWKIGDDHIDCLRIKKFLTWVYPNAGFTNKNNYFGDLTKTYVKKFQASQGLTVDGLWGSKTQAAAKAYKK